MSKPPIPPEERLLPLQKKGKPPSPNPPLPGLTRSKSHTPHERAHRQTQSNPKVSSLSPISPTLRANPYPEVTDLFCRLPLPTLFYQLEAVHLGDLLRLSVRPEPKIILSLGFSRAVESAPDTTRSVMLCRASCPFSR